MLCRVVEALAGILEGILALVGALLGGRDELAVEVHIAGEVLLLDGTTASSAVQGE